MNLNKKRVILIVIFLNFLISSNAYADEILRIKSYELFLNKYSEKGYYFGNLKNLLRTIYLPIPMNDYDVCKSHEYMRELVIYAQHKKFLITYKYYPDDLDKNFHIFNFNADMKTQVYLFNNQKIKIKISKIDDSVKEDKILKEIKKPISGLGMNHIFTFILKYLMLGIIFSIVFILQGKRQKYIPKHNS